MDINVKITIGMSDAVSRAVESLCAVISNGRRTVRTEEATPADPVPMTADAPAPAHVQAATPDMPDAPRVRKIMADTRARLGVTTGTDAYKALNAEFVRIADRLAKSTKPTALPASMINKFEEKCAMLTLTPDGGVVPF